MTDYVQVMKRSWFQSLFLALIAISLLASCGADGNQMREQLAQLEEQNRSDEQMLNDSLAELLVDYFDRHGSANERMRARYMLGRTYFDLGELPRALETYYTARACADTTAADCDYKTLSRIHAQSAKVFALQVHPRNQLNELRQASYYATKAKDTLQAIECYAQQANAYETLKLPDSVIIVKERASDMYRSVGRVDRAAITAITSVVTLLEAGNIDKARNYIRLYEADSGLFDTDGNICKGREIYYYIKGMYYLSVGRGDSAEYIFRKELREGKDLNNQIAGCKGLQSVYAERHLSDSIAKYATMIYLLNDSAYVLSEMQDIRQLQASYNYSHNKLLAEQNKHKVYRLTILLVIVIFVVLLIGLILSNVFFRYRTKKEQEMNAYKSDLQTLEKIHRDLRDICSEDTLPPTELFEKKSLEIVEILNHVNQYRARMKQPTADLEYRLQKSDIVQRLHSLANGNPPKKAGLEDLQRLTELINSEIPQFYVTLNTPRYTLTGIEYTVSMLIRVHFTPTEIHHLTGAASSYISNIRSRLLMRVYGEDGPPSRYDAYLLAIR